jgi:acyl-coenzyme A thioesterase PaaI-like protein
VSDAARSFWDEAEPTTDAQREKRRLATALRELTSVCVTTDADAAALAEAANVVEGMLARLEQHPQRTFLDAFASLDVAEVPLFADRSTLTGAGNPFAPPMTLAMDGKQAVSSVTFGAPFEAVPGCVHGGMVAAAFDQLFGYLHAKDGQSVVTSSLTVRYLKPTPILTELRLEAEVTRLEGRRSHCVGRMRAGDVVTAEAEGLFIVLDAERMNSLILGKNASGGA